MKTVFQRDMQQKERSKEPQACRMPSGMDKPDAVSRRKMQPWTRHPRPCDIGLSLSFPKKATREPRALLQCQAGARWDPTFGPNKATPTGINK